jgi:threonine/homoserine/homoserine lactone efflux protein
MMKDGFLDLFNTLLGQILAAQWSCMVHELPAKIALCCHVEELSGTDLIRAVVFPILYGRKQRTGESGMSQEISSLLLALSILVVGFVSIGPNILAVIGTSMRLGRKEGARLALGVGIGTGLWATLTVAGLTALVTAYAGLLTFLKLFGAAYLMWLAYKAFRSAMTVDDRIRPGVVGGKNLFVRGLAIQMTNPKAALHWIAIVSFGLGADAPLWTGLALIVSATLISVCGHLLYALAFSTPPVVAFYRKFRRWIDGSLGVFFSFAAYKIATYKT